MKSMEVEFNLRSQAWAISVDEKNLYLTAIHNRWNTIQYKGCEVLTDFESRSDEEVQEFIEDFQGRHKVKRGDAYLVFPRSLASLQPLEFPLEAQDSLEEAIGYQVENYFPGDLEAYEFFPQIMSRTDLLKVTIIAIKKERLAHAFGFIRKWNITLAGITLDSFALVNGLQKTNFEMGANSKTMVFQSYPTGLEMLALNEGRIESSYFFNLEDVEDRELLLAHLEQGFSIARMDPNEVDTFLWSGMDLPELKTHLTDEILIPFSELQDASGHRLPPEALCGFGACVSAVQDKLPYSLNVLPENLRKRHKRLPLMLATVALALIAIFFLASEAKEFSGLKKEAARLEKQRAQITESLSAVSDARSKLEAKRAELALYENYQATNLVLKVLHRLSRDLPDDTYLTNFQIKKSRRLTVQGESSQPFEVQRILTRFPFLSDVQPGNAITTGRNKDGKKRFMFKAKINLGALQ